MMTDTTATARDWLTTFGAERSRWPETGRAEVEAAIAASPELRGLEEEMARLDSALHGWATAPAGDSASLTRIIDHADALTRTPASSRLRRPLWLFGGAVAASFVAALMLARTDMVPPPAPAVPTMVAEEESGVDAFRLLFTPTYEEDILI
jgi:anti-sigma factor RsiW